MAYFIFIETKTKQWNIKNDGHSVKEKRGRKKRKKTGCLIGLTLCYIISKWSTNPAYSLLPLCLGIISMHAHTNTHTHTHTRSRISKSISWHNVIRLPKITELWTVSDPCRSRWVTPAGSACPPITRCDSLIRQRCQKRRRSDADRHCCTRGGGGRKRTVWGAHGAAPAASWRLSGCLSKRLWKFFSTGCLQVSESQI